MQSLDWGHLQKVGKDLTSELIVITVQLLDLAFLNLGDEGLSTRIVNIIVLELKLLQCVALGHQ